ncbi:hypothetical protein [Brevibacillus brevis]|uniref:hypothetical protein n=1 Tax=Brevibacillus brevis TaxID=1393 RepID=UPI001C8D172E|nr:hypothetical protein [Brevibacillus brevis]MBY0089037.1 hypothetical protein [Brevibacillus brevis]
MNIYFQASYYILWGLVIVQFIFLTIIMKRLNKNGNTSNGTPTMTHEKEGIPLLEKFPRYVTDINGFRYDLHNYAVDTLLVFTMFKCSKCKDTYPAINNALKNKKGLSVIFFIFGSLDELNELIKEYKIEYPVVQLTHENIEYYNTKSFPFGYFMKADGTIYSKNLIVNEGMLNKLIYLGEENLKRKIS